MTKMRYVVSRHYFPFEVTGSDPTKSSVPQSRKLAIRYVVVPAPRLTAWHVIEMWPLIVSSNVMKSSRFVLDSWLKELNLRVFSNVRRVLSRCNTQLRLPYSLFGIYIYYLYILVLKKNRCFRNIYIWQFMRMNACVWMQQKIFNFSFGNWLSSKLQRRNWKFIVLIGIEDRC